MTLTLIVLNKLVYVLLVTTIYYLLVMMILFLLFHFIIIAICKKQNKNKLFRIFVKMLLSLVLENCNIMD